MMKKAISILRAILLDKAQESTLKKWARDAFIIWPLFILPFTFAISGTKDFWWNWFVGTLIAEVVGTFAFLTVYGVMWIRVIAALIRKAPIPQYRRSWGYLVAAAAMIPGMWLAFQVATFVTARLGRPEHFRALTNYTMGLTFGLGILGIVILLELHRDAEEVKKQAEIEVMRVENERLSAQLSALSAQMNPHLLFNALNTVASLIPESPEKAEEMVVQLAELYRGVLDATKSSFHSLAEELALCRHYLHVEQARFCDRLKVEWNISPHIDCQKIQVPTLTVQPLVENAIRHGLSHKAEGGTVQVKVAANDGNLSIAIEDDGIGLGNAPGQGSGTALANCRSRLKLRFGERGSLKLEPRWPCGTRAILEMPFENGGGVF